MNMVRNSEPTQALFVLSPLGITTVADSYSLPSSTCMYLPVEYQQFSLDSCRANSKTMSTSDCMRPKTGSLNTSLTVTVSCREDKIESLCD